MSDVLAYRLLKKKWRATAFDGEGARRYGGRWNSRGRSCVYLAGSESLAMLEVMVHLDDYTLLRHYLLLEIPLPKTVIQVLPTEQLPRDWREEPAPPSTAVIGDDWLNQADSLALAVPSVVVPRERNYLLNPAHPQFQDVIIRAREIAFQPDARL
ncbi:RES family NAD+ phosphorylase [Alloalcanivorax xenomutans]|uniref:RES family NAD+ phosphorylase n=1 Tax=Alloalcanivorax xenomutans TaxID=1094342 RepID=A0A9Q3W6V5_9GAMM|nr:RES family NAD+ phosphorylase [Alloalcanivorax xenomutans]MCE7509614.1 RES family NAD+ phosphorylase [Alloalcanivorax xenomutans]